MRFVRVQFRWTHCDHLQRPLARYIDSLSLYSSTSASFWHVDNAYHISLHEVHFITVITCTQNTRPDNRRDLEHNICKSPFKTSLFQLAFQVSYSQLVHTPTGNDEWTSSVEPTSITEWPPSVNSLSIVFVFLGEKIFPNGRNRFHFNSSARTLVIFNLF